MITREEARRLAEENFRTHGLGTGVRDVFLSEDVTGRLPLLYGGPDLNACWIAYAERSVYALRSSTVVFLDRVSGAILYRGSATMRGNTSHC